MSCTADFGTVEQVDVTLSSTFRWKIKDFSNISVDIGSSVLSPVFTTADSSVKWHLKLYPNGKTVKESEYLSISVYYCSEIESDASYELSILNADNEVLENYTTRKNLRLVADFESQSEAWIPYRFHPKFVKRSFIEDPDNRIFVDECLTISFEVILQDPNFLNSNENDMENLKDDRLKEFDNFEKLLDNEEFSDVTFIVADEKIQAHKAILAIHSSVFKQLFDRDAMDDDNERRTVVEIADLKYSVLKELFRFMYTGKVNDVYSMADDLLVAAEEYSVKGLKTLCQKTLCRYLDLDNVLELLKIADNRRAKRLKERVLEFIAEHADEIVERDEFAYLRADLLREIVRVMARKKVITENQ